MKYLIMICGVLAAMSASAEPGKPDSAIDLRSLDADGDTMVSLAEAQSAAPQLAVRFNELDKNHDGLLSRAEMFQGQRMRTVKVVRNVEEEFAKSDVDADGRISRAEAADGMPIVDEFFAQMDASGDGFVTLEEIRAHAQATGPILKRVHLKKAE